MVSGAQVDVAGQSSLCVAHPEVGLDLEGEMRQRNERMSGFSLIEVLIAIMIVGIVAAAVVPLIGEYAEQARVARVMANLKQVKQAVTRYALEHKAPWGFVYDPNDPSEVVKPYKHAGLEGFAAQLQEPTDIYGNVMGDPIGSVVGPFDAGPYALDAFVPVPAALLLAAKPTTLQAAVPKSTQAYVNFVVDLTLTGTVDTTTTPFTQTWTLESLTTGVRNGTGAEVVGTLSFDPDRFLSRIGGEGGDGPSEDLLREIGHMSGEAIAATIGREYDPDMSQGPSDELLAAEKGPGTLAILAFRIETDMPCGNSTEIQHCSEFHILNFGFVFTGKSVRYLLSPDFATIDEGRDCTKCPEQQQQQ